jgi:hypothetical protein
MWELHLVVEVSFCNTHIFKPYHTPRGPLVEIYNTNVCMYYNTFYVWGYYVGIAL